ncbi:MAG: glycosyltransferase family 4 protein [Planctomycetota bacterium]
MHLAILHYHLNRGGVTQAILNHLEALATCPTDAQPKRVALVSCGRREGWPDGDWRQRLPFSCEMVVVPGLEYDDSNTADAGGLADALIHGLEEIGFPLDDTLIHSHNHSLGKNASLPGALAILAERGCRLLLQVHDFAEDFRPANYRHLTRSLRARTAADLAATLYPQARGIHYATLTGRDHGLLSQAGVPVERLHVLPNPIVDFHGLPPEDDARVAVRLALDVPSDARLVVYPVRGIRRKNLGEMLLHSALAEALGGGERCYAVTLAPENPVERASFDRWQQLAEQCELNCRFDIGGHGVPFTDALAACDAILTTSVAEGFGMVFLEAWLAGRPLVGRDLPEITQDFLASGLEFRGLRSELRVPLSWVDTAELRRQLVELHGWACRDFNIAPPGDTAAQLETLLGGDSIDFASLTTACQAQAINKAADNPSHALAELVAINDGLSETALFDGEGQAELIAPNAERVHQAYSPAAIGSRLSEIYGRVMADAPGKAPTPPPAGDFILDHFLRLDRLRPVRIEA